MKNTQKNLAGFSGTKDLKKQYNTRTRNKKRMKEKKG